MVSGWAIVLLYLKEFSIPTVVWAVGTATMSHCLLRMMVSRLFLKPMGMVRMGQDNEKPLTSEGAAEYYWSLFIERLQ